MIIIKLRILNIKKTNCKKFLRLVLSTWIILKIFHIKNYLIIQKKILKKKPS